VSALGGLGPAQLAFAHAAEDLAHTIPAATLAGLDAPSSRGGWGSDGGGGNGGDKQRARKRD
jgi:hypothetical protein